MPAHHEARAVAAKILALRFLAARLLAVGLDWLLDWLRSWRVQEQLEQLEQLEKMSVQIQTMDWPRKQLVHR